MSGLQVSNVSKKYKQKVALSPCSFYAETGSSIVLCGGNGAGKSTLLQIIAGILSPSSGTVTLNGQSLQENRKSYLENLGFMPDDFHAQDTMTVLEFLTFYGSFRKVHKERILEVIELVGLTDKKRELIKNLSKGMRQRLLFGQAFLAEPSLLLLDEPTNGLDPYWVNIFIDLLKEIKKNGTTIVFSTHMMDVAAEVGDVILFMKQGEIIETIVNDDKNEETALQLLRLHRE